MIFCCNYAKSNVLSKCEEKPRQAKRREELKRKLRNTFIIIFTLFMVANVFSSSIIKPSDVYASSTMMIDDDVMPYLATIPELTDEYKIIETYETNWTESLAYNIQYDKYEVFPHYVVNIGSVSRRIYEEPSTSTQRLDRIYYGEKFQVVALIENEDEQLWYAVVCEYNDETVIGYVKESQIQKREFQLDAMNKHLQNVSSFESLGHVVYAENYRTVNGNAPRMPNGSYYDDFGYRRGQSIAGYHNENLEGEFRYIPDGMLGIVEQIVEITKIEDETIVIDSKGKFIAKEQLVEYYEYAYNHSQYEANRQTAIETYNESTQVLAVKIYVPSFGVSLWVNDSHINEEEDAPDALTQTIIVDRKNQNIVVFEYKDEWKVVSINYATTGKPGEFSLPTPLGYYMAIAKKPKFDYLQDGTTTVVGFAPHVIRFSGGGYLHGVPMKYKFDEFGTKESVWKYVEYLASIGTTPKSHMCVRNYTSHAEFMYKWIDIGSCAVIVME